MRVKMACWHLLLYTGSKSGLDHFQNLADRCNHIGLVIDAEADNKVSIAHAACSAIVAVTCATLVAARRCSSPVDCVHELEESGAAALAAPQAVQAFSLSAQIV